MSANPPTLTAAQEAALVRLAGIKGAAELKARATFDLIGWKQGEPATLFVSWCGMLVGIEPDGYTHT